MRRDLTALIAAVGLASASQTIFSIHDDIDAFPQYNVAFSPARVSSHEATDLLESPISPYEADSSSIPIEYTRLVVHSLPYLCGIPRPRQEPRNLTSEALHKASLALELSRANTHGWELLAPLGKSCLYYTSGWWSYKFCYNDSVTQYHALPPQLGHSQSAPVRDKRTPKFVLGRARKIPGYDPKVHGKFYDDGADEDSESRSDLELRGSHEDSSYYEEDMQGTLQNNGDTRYLTQKMSGGTLCDLTMRPREVEIQYHCGATSDDRIAWIKEVTTCSYLMVVHTPRLCSDVAFQPQAPPETHEIVCRQIIGEEGFKSSNTGSAGQDGAYDEDASATTEKSADSTKSLAKGEGKSTPLIIGGTVVGGGQYFPASDPPLLKPPPNWRTKKPFTVAKSQTRIEKVKGVGNSPGHSDSEELAVGAVGANARLDTDGDVIIKVLAHGQGQSDDYQMMNEDDLRKLKMSTKAVKGLAEQLRKTAGNKGWTLALVEGEGVDGREIRGVIDATGVDGESLDGEGGTKEWAWEEVEELLFGNTAEDRSPGWKEREKKAKEAQKPKKGKSKAKGQTQNDAGDDENGGSEEKYYKDEL